MIRPVNSMVFSSSWLRMRNCAVDLLRNCRGVAATEFAVIVPIMLVLFFGTVEFSSAIAVNRKVTLIARTLSDLTSRMQDTVTDTDLTNFFAASAGIMAPYPSTPINATISEVYVDPVSLLARVQWSKGSAPRPTGSTFAIPTGLQVAGTYLIYAEVNYTYVPSIGYAMSKTGIRLSDYAYTRPRYSLCVMYSTTACTKS